MDGNNFSLEKKWKVTFHNVMFLELNSSLKTII